LSESFDVIVIGAGIAGASAAFFLAPYARVAIVEREPQPGHHSTGRSAAMFEPAYGPAPVRALTRASRVFFEGVEGALGRARGCLFVARADQRDALARLHAQLRAEQAQGIERVDARAARALVPVLCEDAATAALLDHEACDIDVHCLHQHFLRGARAHGAVLHCDGEVQAMALEGARWRVQAGGMVLHAPVVVNAAGAWADAIGTLAGARALGLQPRRRSAFTFAPPHGVDVGAWPLVVGIDEDFYFKPDAGVLLGSPANADPVAPHDVVAEELDVACGIARIEAATTLTIRRPLRTWAGLRSFVPDGVPVADFDDARAGFFWCCGQGGYGIQTSAALGELCAARVLGRALPAPLAAHGVTFEALRCRH
jgi:D-arginine dehydrogenase